MTPGQSVTGEAVFVVPGIPDTYQAYEVTPAGLRPLRHKRVSGGVRVELNGFGLGSVVLLTQDTNVVRFTMDHLREKGRRAAELRRHLSGHLQLTAETIHQRLVDEGQVPPEMLPPLATLLRTARSELQQADHHLTVADFHAAYLAAGRATRPLSILMRRHGDRARRSLGSPVAGPLACQFTTLPEHWRFATYLQAAHVGANQLPAGEFESLASLTSAGWEHLQFSQQDLKPSVHLAREAARTGRSGLRLRVRSNTPDPPPEMVEATPVWVTSAPVPVGTGQLVRIQGWVNVPRPLTGSIDGLLIYDSLGGEPLAQRFAETSGWQPFTLFRVAPANGTLRVTFALTGMGEAWIDDVKIQPVIQSLPAGRDRTARR
jgi:hypothetical protein